MFDLFVLIILIIVVLIVETYPFEVLKDDNPKKRRFTTKEKKTE